METIKNLIDELKEVKFNSFDYYSFIISDLFEEIENQIIINTFLNNLSSSDKVEEDEIITNMEVEEDETITNMDASRAGIGNEVANFEEPVEYAYQWGTSEIYKIVGPLNETHF